MQVFDSKYTREVFWKTKVQLSKIDFYITILSELSLNKAKKTPFSSKAIDMERK